MKTDFLIIGSGIAGLSFAIKAASNKNNSITLISKDNLFDSNTKYAQGGIAGVISLSEEEIRSHIKDTILTGNMQSNQKVVERVVRKARDEISELINIGIKFDKDNKGEFHKNIEAGHKEARILHYKDITGKEIHTKLLRYCKKLNNITILKNHFAIELINKDNSCVGAHIINFNNANIITIFSKITIIATGGIGQAYMTTSNSKGSTGDGIALADKIGAKIKHMELIQFHPTSIYNKKNKRNFLVTEAIRGAGAILKNIKGERYMEKYDNRKELAPRDIVSKATQKEMHKTNSDYVLMDTSVISLNLIKDKFPNIYKRCSELGIDLPKDNIPITPCVHYLIGGIETDINGKTNINNLYACGECAYTGLHGTNRLASNSLLECLVFADLSYTYAEKSLNKIILYDKEVSTPNIDLKLKDRGVDLKVKEIKKALNRLMNSYLFIEKTRIGIEIAEKKLKEIEIRLNEISGIKTLKSIELFNLIITSKLIVEHCKKTDKNSGVFYNKDLE